MTERVRPSGTANIPTRAEQKQAIRAVDAVIADLANTAERVTRRLSRIAHPVERAKAVMKVREFATGDLAASTDALLRDAVIEAYARGRAGHGWYGYGALGEALGISRARVQQIVNGTWKGDAKDQGLVVALRERADQQRQVRRLAAAGVPLAEIAAQSGLNEDAVSELLG